MKQRNIIRFRKWMRMALGLAMILVFCFPLGYSFWVPTEIGPEEWYTWYLHEDELSLFFLLPFYLFFPLYLINERKSLQIIFKVALFIAAAAVSMYGMILTGMPAQDYAPGEASFLLLTFFPGIIYLFYLDWWERYNAEKEAKTAIN